MTSQTDPRSKVYGQIFDALNRLITQTDPDSHVTTTAYNPSDQITSVTDARSHATSYTRDGFGDVIRQTSPDTGTTDMWYDAAGRMIKSVDAGSIETDFDYDSAGRLASYGAPGASATKWNSFSWGTGTWVEEPPQPVEVASHEATHPGAYQTRSSIPSATPQASPVRRAISCGSRGDCRIGCRGNDLASFFYRRSVTQTDTRFEPFSASPSMRCVTDL